MMTTSLHRMATMSLTMRRAAAEAKRQALYLAFVALLFYSTGVIRIVRVWRGK